MPIVKDANGRDWDITIPNFASVIRIREQGIIDLNKIGHASGELYDLLHGDAETVLRVAHAITGGSAPIEMFHEGVTGEVLDDVRKALFEAVVDFFHKRRAEEVKARLAELMLAKDGSSAMAAN